MVRFESIMTGWPEIGRGRRLLATTRNADLDDYTIINISPRPAGRDYTLIAMMLEARGSAGQIRRSQSRSRRICKYLRAFAQVFH